VRRASAAGLSARPELRCGAAADVGDVLDALAEEYGADLVVVGRRDSSRLEAAVFGSTSKDAVRQSRRPVLVVPYPRG
jgi:nucleotide-binding universal stress UspA family protein